MSEKEKIEKSLDALKKGVESLPSGNLKDDAEGAIRFLSQVLGGGGNPTPQIGSCFGALVIQ